MYEKIVYCTSISLDATRKFTVASYYSRYKHNTNLTNLTGSATEWNTMSIATVKLSREATISKYKIVNASTGK